MANILVRSGERFYGTRWQTEIARHLGMSDRIVRRMSSWHDSRFDQAFVLKLRALCEQRVVELMEARALLAGAEAALFRLRKDSDIPEIQIGSQTQILAGSSTSDAIHSE